MFTAYLLYFLWALLPIIHALPAPQSNPQKRCSNLLANPSFESGESPWQTMALGSWETRGIYTSSEGGHEGNNFFYAHTNATVADATMNLSQYGFSIPSGAAVDCSAWIASRRPGNVGATKVQVMLDGQTCGEAYFGTNGWIKVGGKVTVGEGPHTMAIVVLSDQAGPDGASVWVDDAFVGSGC